MNLTDLGYHKKIENHFNSYRSEELAPARICAVNKNNFQLLNENGESYAELSGKFMYELDSSLALPTVGDWVAASFFDHNSLAIIHQIIPRQSLLKRRDPGKKLDYQLIAANIDIAFIIQSLDSNFNLNRLERYLVMVNESKIEPVILFSKTDLLSPSERSEIKILIERIDPRYKSLLFSNQSGEGLEEVRKLLLPQKTYCLLGSSGVGKTTLLNTLLGDQKLKVREVRSSDNKGRHTTSSRQLIILNNGSLLIDTPGMRELGNIILDNGITSTFSDIEQIVQRCRFSDCSHTNEVGCAILEAVASGEIDQKKFDNYLKLKKESAFYKLSYLEKRKRDRSFGKLCKQIMKNHRKK